MVVPWKVSFKSEISDYNQIRLEIRIEAWKGDFQNKIFDLKSLDFEKSKLSWRGS